ncbi:MAG: helix-turn-helix domain-containing protein [Sphingomonas sp.]|uniref:helix-turn-helix domain-containing protein n=1 Tax=Sphingomonas sp. TaxID=28214 RepID=UPI001AFF6EF9|nr:helix-turn-helix domain-containing protein [Sphingomonas sp.]MBO9622123.1 helix-turn-helix domain-containing protein [Sphingomonas sp.]
MEGETAQEPTLFPTTVGEKLRAAREAQGLDLSEIASRTRIPQRHLEAIESGNYAGLPSVTYALGFAKAYARAVGADEVAIGRELRQELGDNPERAAPVPSYEMQDPKRVPPRGLAWAGLIVALLVLAGVALWYGTSLFRGEAPLPPETLPIEANEATPAPAADANATAPAAAPAPASGDQVTLVATDTVWVRVSDATGQRLFEKEMAPGERFDVPRDANGPRLRTGRPDRLQVLVNGSSVAPLGTGERTIEAEVSAAALKARPAEPAVAATASPAANTIANP